MKLESPENLQPALTASAPRWYSSVWTLSTLLTMAMIAWVLVWYGETTLAMIGQWTRYETYTHGFIIAPISLYLIWTRRQELAKLTPTPGLLGAVALIPLGFLWLLARLVEAQVIQQYALVLMVIATVYAILGRRITWAMAFPLGFLLLCVPVGEALTEWLMNYTADFTVGMVKLSGIPVYREGNSFSIPSGEWSVVEACSGLRYLIASITGGCLFAYLYFQSYWKRAAMILASIVIPIVANGFRAYMIVMIGHLSSMRLAVGADHILYGWVFFGFVMFLLFWVASRWTDGIGIPTPAISGVENPQTTPRTGIAMLLTAVSVILVAGIWPIYAGQLNAKILAAPKIELNPPSPSGAWQAVNSDALNWRPRFVGADRTVSQTYHAVDGNVTLFVAQYFAERTDAKLITSTNVLVGSLDKQWQKVGSSIKTELNGTLELRETQLKSVTTRMLAWSWYAIGEKRITNPYIGKLLLAKRAIVDGSGAGSLVVVVAMDDEVNRARSRLRRFMQELGSSFDKTHVDNRPGNS